MYMMLNQNKLKIMSRGKSRHTGTQYAIWLSISRN